MNSEKNIVKIGSIVLAVIYFLMGLGAILTAVLLFFSMFGDGFSLYVVLNVFVSVGKGILQLGMGAGLVLMGFSQKGERRKDLFAAITAVGVGIIVLTTVLGLFDFIYYAFEGYGFKSVGMMFGAFFKSLIWQALVCGIVYVLLSLEKETLTLDYYKNQESFGQYCKKCVAAVTASAEEFMNRTSAKNTNTDFEARFTKQEPVEARPISETRPTTEVSTIIGKVVPLKTDRGLLGYILLSILTCGIYGYYFIYSVAKDVNVACEGDGVKTGGLAKFIILSILTCGIYSLIWQYSLANRLASNATRYGLNFQENGTSVLLWYIFGSLICGIGPFIAMNIIIKNTNSICMAYNAHHGLLKTK